MFLQSERSVGVFKDKMQYTITSLWYNVVSWVLPVLRSSVAKNAVSLYLIQFANYILPLITVPYLVRVLEPAGFGLISFGQSFIAYFAMFVDYGFHLSATRRISVERENPAAVNRIVFNVWAAKSLLCVVGLVLLVLFTAVVPKLRESSTLLLILYGTVIGNVLFPTWLFQGMEKMVFISIINLMVRILVLAGMFALVRRPEDCLIYAGLLSVGSIVAGLAGAGIAIFNFKLHPVVPSLRGIWEALVEGWMLFLSMASVSLYTVGNAFILGLLTNLTVVGYYSAAERIVKAILGLLGPISQAAYPRFSKMASESRDLALQWAKRMLVFMGGVGFGLSLVIFITAPVIVNLVLGPDYGPSIMVMRILAGLCLFVVVSNILGVQIMFAFRYERAVFLRVLMAGIINVILALFLIPQWHANGMALAVLFSEIFVAATCLIFVQNKLNLYQKSYFKDIIL